MTAIRFVSVPIRAPGESGRAFIDRMLAELDSKGAASAAPIPPKIVITAEVKSNARPIRRVRPARDPAPAADTRADAGPAVAKPAEPEREIKPGTSPDYVNGCEAWRLAAEKSAKVGKVMLDWLGRPDTRPTTKTWPPGPMGPDGRSTHRYVGPWPPKWASKWTKNPKKA
jgi:hypothetical protein